MIVNGTGNRTGREPAHNVTAGPTEASGNLGRWSIYPCDVKSARTAGAELK